jgi:hypothetical protein
MAELWLCVKRNLIRVIGAKVQKPRSTTVHGGHLDNKYETPHVGRCLVETDSSNSSVFGLDPV